MNRVVSVLELGQLLGDVFLEIFKLDDKLRDLVSESLLVLVDFSNGSAPRKTEPLFMSRLVNMKLFLQFLDLFNFFLNQLVLKLFLDFSFLHISLVPES